MDFLVQHLDELSEFSNLQIGPAALEQKSPNFIILFTTHEKVINETQALYKKNWFVYDPSPEVEWARKKYLNENEYRCLGIYNTSSNNEIVQATAIIFTEYPEDIIFECIVEETAQALGLPGDIRWPAPTIV